MFATADTIGLHPNSFGLLKRQKDTLNRYLLTASPQSGRVDTIWDMKVVQTTKLPPNYAIVFDSKVAILAFTRQALTIDMNMWSDTAWTNNQVLWRGEERIAVGYQNPKAINIVEGFPGSGS
jgi:HK97 family phage major capsid protein